MTCHVCVRRGAMPGAHPRLLYYAVVALATFGLTRTFDRLAAPLSTDAPTRHRADDVRALSHRQLQIERRRASQAATFEQPAPVDAAVGGAAASVGASRRPPLAVIGFPVGVDDRNRERRALLRELWYPEYANLGPVGKAVRAEFIIGLLTYQGDGHDAPTVRQLHDEHVTHGDLALVNAREATRDPYRGDPKCTGEKILAWFAQVSAKRSAIALAWPVAERSLPVLTGRRRARSHAILSQG